MKYLFLLPLLFAGCTKNLLREPVTPSSVIAHPVGYQWPEKSAFTVLSWNVEHFVDSYDNPYIRNAREDNPPQNMAQRRDLLVKALRQADADIVLLQEFENAAYLKQLARESLSDMGYQFFADAPSPDWYMNVVVMSRYPLGELISYGAAHTPLPGWADDEGNMETQSMINTRMWTMQLFPASDYAFYLTGVHLKAGRSQRDVAMRKGQINLLGAQFARLLKENKNVNLMMAGDFNAYPNSEELGLLKQYRLRDPLDSLVNTHPADNPQRRLDYMIFNKKMEKELEFVEVRYFFSADSMRIISDHLPLMGKFLNSDK